MLRQPLHGAADDCFDYFQGKADDAWNDSSREVTVHHAMQKQNCAEIPTANVLPPVHTSEKSLAVGADPLAKGREVKSFKDKRHSNATGNFKIQSVQQLSPSVKGLGFFAGNEKLPTSMGSGRGTHEKLEVNKGEGQAAELLTSSGDTALPSQQVQRYSLIDLPPALILEIFSHIDARDLCVASCVCSTFQRLAAESVRWKDLYCQRWLPPALSEGRVSAEGCCRDDSATAVTQWRELYLEREVRSRAFQGRFRLDFLHGHTAGVRCARLLPSANLAVTGGYDSTVRIWDLEQGLPLAASAPLGETVRAIAVDNTMLAVGSTDSVIRIWRSIPGCPHLFDVGSSWPAGRIDRETGKPRDKEIDGCGGLFVGMSSALHSHAGPISCIVFDSGKMYSGSWDMTVRMWQQDNLTCIRTFNHGGWVWAIAARGTRLYSTAGSNLYTWDVESGELLCERQNVHQGQASAIEANRSGEFVFTGGEDGAVRMFDERAKRRSKLAVVVENGAMDAVAEWRPHVSGIRGLALEDPWLVCASADNTCSLMNVWQVILNRSSKKRSEGGRQRRDSTVGESSRSSLRTAGGRVQAVVREGIEEPILRQLGGFPSLVYSIDIGAHRVICAGQDTIVRVFDFTQALETERRVEASRRVRVERRFQRRHGRQRSGDGGSAWPAMGPGKAPLDLMASPSESNEDVHVDGHTSMVQPLHSEGVSDAKSGKGKFREPGAAKQRGGREEERREGERREGERRESGLRKPGEGSWQQERQGCGSSRGGHRSRRYVDSVHSRMVLGPSRVTDIRASAKDKGSTG